MLAPYPTELEMYSLCQIKARPRIFLRRKKSEFYLWQFSYKFDQNLISTFPVILDQKRSCITWYMYKNTEHVLKSLIINLSFQSDNNQFWYRNHKYFLYYWTISKMMHIKINSLLKTCIWILYRNHHAIWGL